MLHNSLTLKVVTLMFVETVETFHHSTGRVHKRGSHKREAQACEPKNKNSFVELLSDDNGFNYFVT
jgi:hypothetical protein